MFIAFISDDFPSLFLKHQEKLILYPPSLEVKQGGARGFPTVIREDVNEGILEGEVWK
jgi:hypothetical protein